MNPKTPISLWPDPNALGAVTDLYQITMMAGYRAHQMEHKNATFELFVRRLPNGRSYLIFAGLEQAVGDLLRLAFSEEHINALKALPIFGAVAPTFFDWLAALRFEGDLWSVPEGTVVFAGEPLVRVRAPLAQAQWVETYLLASLSYPTLVASKAARVVEAASGRPLYDFGARRSHGPYAGLVGARASYLAGFDGTSNVEAGLKLGIPLAGTMAHSWVQSFPTEHDAFTSFARVFPNHATLLVDTYDTLKGVTRASAIEPAVSAVRLDSGDLLTLSRAARSYLDEHGLSSVRIFASGDLEEHAIRRLLADGAPIDAFGVGTELITSRDAPAIAMVYKLVEIDGAGCMKLSPGKKTYPMAKQIRRTLDEHGIIVRDVVTRADEPMDGDPLLVPVLKDGRLVAALPSLTEIREYCAKQRASVPARLRKLDDSAQFEVEYSKALEAEASHWRQS